MTIKRDKSELPPFILPLSEVLVDRILTEERGEPDIDMVRDLFQIVVTAFLIELYDAGYAVHEVEEPEK